MVIAAVSQALGTLCLVSVVAMVTTCDSENYSRRRPPPPCCKGGGGGAGLSPCAGFAPDQACITEGNLRVCHELLAAGCAPQDMLVLESCPVQFSCSGSSSALSPPPPSPGDDCGPVGQCGANSQCQGSCPFPGPCASVHCVCNSGFHGCSGVSCEGGCVPTTISPPTATAPSGGGSSVMPSSTSAPGDGPPFFCGADDWVTTKVLGMLGGLLLVGAAPLLSCQTQGCAGCVNRNLTIGWALYCLAALIFAACGVLGLGYEVAIPMAVPVIGTLLFDAAFVSVALGRWRLRHTQRSSAPTATEAALLVRGGDSSQCVGKVQAVAVVVGCGAIGDAGDGGEGVSATTRP